MCFVLFFLIFYHLFEIMEPFYKYNLYLCSQFGEKSGLTIITLGVAKQLIGL